MPAVFVVLVLATVALLAAFGIPLDPAEPIFAHVLMGLAGFVAAIAVGMSQAATDA